MIEGAGPNARAETFEQFSRASNLARKGPRGPLLHTWISIPETKCGQIIIGDAAADELRRSR